MLFIIYNLIGVPTRRLVRYRYIEKFEFNAIQETFLCKCTIPNFIDTLTHMPTHLSQNFINKKSTSIKLLFSLDSKFIKKNKLKSTPILLTFYPLVVLYMCYVRTHNRIILIIIIAFYKEIANMKLIL